MKILITYIILLSLQVPFNVTFFLSILTSDEKAWSINFGIFYLVIAVLYFFILGIIGIGSILKSFKAYRAQNFEYCINGLMLLKYGMVPFFIVNFLSMSALALMLLVASRGTVIFAAPFLLAFAMFCTWLAMLPSSFFGLQVVRFGVDDGKISKGKVWHILFQFCFLLDVLDTVYIAAVKYKRGRIFAIIVCVVYVLCALLAWSPLKEFILQ